MREIHFDLGGARSESYYPSPITRKQPEWIFELLFGFDSGEEEATLGDLLGEVYQAVAGGQYRLAALGIRALLEHVMILKVGDIGGFDRKLDEFQKQGYINPKGCDASDT